MGKGPKVPQSSIDAQVGLQTTEADLLKKYSGLALPALGSASNYWADILKGGPSAQAATAPYAQTIAGQTAAAQKQIQNNLPAGGEKNLALAQLPIAGATSVANLYQGLGPMAASQLQALGLGSAGAGTGSGGVSASAGSANESLAAQQAQAKGSMFGGIGQGLGSLAGGAMAGKGAGAGAGAAKGAGGAAAKGAETAAMFV